VSEINPPSKQKNHFCNTSRGQPLFLSKAQRITSKQTKSQPTKGLGELGKRRREFLVEIQNKSLSNFSFGKIALSKDIFY
jgi:hypothetical protein